MANNWTEKQKLAIDTSGCNVLVAAAAGSGKTAVLVERIVGKITDSEHPVDIDRLVVVTFTKAAAAEMKQRIRTAVEQRLYENPENEQLQRQLTLIHNAQITTIDSFCLNIVRNYFTELDIDPGFRTADEGEIKLLENDVMEEMLEEYYAGGDDAFFDFVDAYGVGRDDSGIVNLVLKIYRFARSYPWEEEWYDACNALYAVTEEKDLDSNAAVQYLWADIMQRLKDYDRLYVQLEEICTSPAGPEMYLAAIQSDHAAIRMMLHSNSFSELSRLVSLVSFDTLGRGRSKEISEEKKELVKNARNEYKDFVTKTLKGRIFSGSAQSMAQDISDNAPAIQMMITLAKDFSARMQAEKKARNIIDFNDMEHMALNVLVHREAGKNCYTQAADILSDFYEEILIDEYQDSNLLQEVILTAVSKGRRNPKDNNIYMVGDVKQSIYKFRLACPELFIEKYNAYTKEAGENVKIELQTNFRSRANVLESANDVFSRLMNPDFCGITYDAAARLNPGFDYPACAKGMDFGGCAQTEIYVLDSENTEDLEMTSREAEAHAVADIILALTETKADGSVQMVYDKNVQGNYRKIRYSDIVVLTRTVTGWADTFVNILMSRGIPAYSDACAGYFNVREIQLILSFLTVIDNPLQDIPMAAVLLSYFGRMDTEELTKLRTADKKSKLYEQLKRLTEQNAEEMQEVQPPQEAQIIQKAASFLKMLCKYRDKAEIMSVHDLIWDILYDTGYYDYVGTMPAGSRRQANLDILLERAAAFENTSYKGLFNFLRYIERMQKFEVDFAEASMLGENEDLVRIMSIHKSKGLEFPVVILAGMGKKINLRDASGEVVIDQQLGVGTNVVRLADRTKNATLIKAAVSQKLIRDSISEEMRVLYVAMTRAREKLIMTGMVKKAEKAAAGWQAVSAVLRQQGMYSYSDAAACSSYFDMVMPAAYMPQEENNGHFLIHIRTAERADTAEQTDIVQQADITEAAGDAQRKDTAEETKTAGTAQKTQEKAQADAGSEKEPYPYPLNPMQKSKVTVSELKKMQHDADMDAQKMYAGDIPALSEDEAAADVVIPKFISGISETLAGNERGTAYHRVMECVDYTALESDAQEKTAAALSQQLADMVQTERLTKIQADSIDIQDIVGFCASDIGKRVYMAAKAGNIRREQPFVFVDETIDDTQLIQGVIDLYLVEPEGITIVDYKTDHVAKGKKGEAELKRRYAVQLDYYARALQQLTGLKVREKIIYSFTLGKSISV